MKQTRHSLHIVNEQPRMVLINPVPVTLTYQEFKVGPPMRRPIKSDYGTLVHVQTGDSWGICRYDPETEKISVQAETIVDITLEFDGSNIRAEAVLEEYTFVYCVNERRWLTADLGKLPVFLRAPTEGFSVEAGFPITGIPPIPADNEKLRLDKHNIKFVQTNFGSQT